MAHAFDRVIGVGKLNRVGAEQSLKGAESFAFALVGHHPGMRGGSHDRDSEAESGERVAGPDAASDVGRAGAEHAGFGRVGAPGPEFDYAAASSGPGDERGLGGDQSLEGESGE